MNGAAVDHTLPLVRDSVRNVLQRSESFRALPPDERRRLAHDMVKVARYIVDAGGETAGVPVHAQIATGLADAAPPPQSAADKFTGNVASKSTGSFTDTINKVDFPKFVGGLVEGVFNAIVSSSIRQMEAYSEMVANIAKSADQYMKDNVTENQARDYLAGKYPEHLQVTTTKDGAKLGPRKPKRGGRPDRGRDAAGRSRGQELAQSLAGTGPFGIELPDFQKDLGLPGPVQKLDEKTVEQQLVPAARMRIAMDRQQLLATMVLMGINRLIVTDGRISASCLFQLDTSEAVYDDKTYASDWDSTYTGFGYNPASTWYGPTVWSNTSNFKVSTTNDSSSEATASMHAELTGNVDINFRSETFPLEKMADILQIKEIEQKAPAAAATPVSAAPAPNLPPPPPLPNLPGSPFAPPAPAAPPAGG